VDAHLGEGHVYVGPVRGRVADEDDDRARREDGEVREAHEDEGHADHDREHDATQLNVDPSPTC